MTDPKSAANARSATPAPVRLVLNQTLSWSKALSGQGAYSTKHCCYCAKPVKPGAAQLRICRTADGEWWLIPDRRLTEDELEPFGMSVLPIGPDCLRQHPEFRFALMPEQENADD